MFIPSDIKYVNDNSNNTSCNDYAPLNLNIWPQGKINYIIYYLHKCKKVNMVISSDGESSESSAR